MRLYPVQPSGSQRATVNDGVRVGQQYVTSNNRCYEFMANGFAISATFQPTLASVSIPGPFIETLATSRHLIPSGLSAGSKMLNEATVVRKL